MKVIAMYLPQFHRVRENDEWWGEGFTEWTSVRSAEKLFPEHEQPNVPLGRRYYDLMDPATMRWQADLMHRYGVDGMCFYHYYFKDGRRILERPAENLLHWKDIDMPFCFSWANESWVRSWSRLAKNGGNPWSAKFDPSGTRGSDGLLLEQSYGGEDAWRAHYEYLSPFFHDPRYILHDNQPLFLIYKPNDIPCLHSMIQLWDEIAREEGFDGVYVIGSNVDEYQRLGLKGAMLQEPGGTSAPFFTQRDEKVPQVRMLFDYKKAWQRIIDRPVAKGVSLGGFVGYDDTPRRGRDGCVYRHRSPDAFGRGMRALLAKAERNASPYVFVNAWNEWGEGMYLEPDERYGYAFLEALKEAREAYKPETVPTAEQDSVVTRQRAFLQSENAALRKTCDRYQTYWKTLDIWMECREQRRSIATWLRTQKVASVAIYGLGMLGRHLLWELEKEDYPVRYSIDQQQEGWPSDLEVHTLDDDLPAVDAVIVTVLYDFKRIQSVLAKKGTWKILALDEVLGRMRE